MTNGKSKITAAALMMAFLFSFLSCQPSDDDDTAPNCGANGECRTECAADPDCTDCIDIDGDGYGYGCFAGVDCDDSLETGGDCNADCLTVYADADGDGYGAGRGDPACTLLSGFAELDGDCNDADAYSNPGTAEVCNNKLDNDCDGLADALDLDCCADLDGDGVSAGPGCTGETDCDDDDPDAWRASDCLACYDYDYDGVPYGKGCTVPTDCDDDNPWSQFDCDTCVDLDFDMRGVGCDLGPDCDDADTMTYDGAPEYPGDGVDNDCAGDGDMTPSDESGIFISISTGDDANTGTMSAPVSSVTRGIELAEASGLGAVFVAAGVYDEVLKAKVSVFGGYNPDDWTRDIGKYRPTIGGEIDGPHSIGGYHSTTDVIVDGIRLYGGSSRLAHTTDRNFWSLAWLGGPRPVLSNSIIDYDVNFDDSWQSLELAYFWNGLLFNNIIVSMRAPTISGYDYNYYSEKTVLVNNLVISIPSSLGDHSSPPFIAGYGSEIILLINNIFSSKKGSGIVTGSGDFVMSGNLFDIGNDDHFRTDEWRGADELNSCIDSGCIEARGNVAASSYYADPIGGDYSVNATSPTIDAGVDPAAYFLHLDRYTPGPIDGDGDGVPQWDIGPVEYTP